MSELDDSPWGPRRAAGMVLGPAGFLAILLWVSPAGLPPEGRRALAVLFLTACWWITETIPIAATALVPLVLFPVLGILTVKEASERYADEIVFLLIGGSLIALAMERWNLHRRIALRTILLLGDSPRRIVLAFMLATAFVSLWISNTASALMMMPIAMSVASQMEAAAPPDRRGEIRGLGICLALGVGYSASVGGVGTLIGTPTNAVFAGFAADRYPDLPPVSFLRWTLIGFPLAAVFVPLMWLYLTRLAAPVGSEPLAGGRDVVRSELARLGPTGRGEMLVLAVFLAAVALWITREDVSFGGGPVRTPSAAASAAPERGAADGADGQAVRGWGSRLQETLRLTKAYQLKDSTVAMAAALLLFLLPVSLRRGEFCLDWAWAQRIPWSMVLLIGGGFCLATGIEKSGLATWVGGMFEHLRGLPPFVVILAVAFGTTVLTEFASNLATISMLLPVLAPAAEGMHLHPYLLMFPAAIAATFGFMFPAGTPPNAIAYATGRVPMGRMVRAGFALDLLGSVTIAAVVYFLAGPVFGWA